MLIYTDGSCSKNPNGVGGWSYLIWDGKKKLSIKERVGRDFETTSNRMELTAIYEALKDNDNPLCVFSDSLYAVNCISGKWKAKVNLDIIHPARNLLNGRDILRWLRGHNGDEANELADRLCGEAMREAYLERYGMPFVNYAYQSIDVF